MTTNGHAANGNGTKLDASSIRLRPGEGGKIQMLGVTPATAKAANEVLTDNHQRNHCFFNAIGEYQNFIKSPSAPQN